ncbi:MAG: C39 family peptidase [Cyanobacteriota bacterium]|nr:C39 family peptidase [Cyanobacteriota bacterium]
MSVLSYLSPKETTVGRSTVLRGTFDPAKVTDISVIAEDRFPLPVAMNPGDRTWRVNLDRGFSGAGVRWLRLKGTNGSGGVESDRVVYLTVSPQPMAEAEGLSVKVLQDTWLKVAPLDSGSLNNEQKVLVRAGETLKIRRYAPARGHLALELESAVSPVGEFGYFYQPHVRLSWQGQDFFFEEDELPSPPPGTILVWVGQDTKIKAVPESSSALSGDRQVTLFAGQTLIAYGYACVSGHFRVTLRDSIPKIGNSGYLYEGHVRLKQGDEWIEYDRNAFTVTLEKTTPFKKRPIDSSELSAAEKVTLNAGMIYGMSSYALEGSHFRVALTENIPGFGNTGYLFADFVQIKQGGQPFNTFPSLSYQGPVEVRTGQPTVLQGTFDPSQAVAVSVVAEDKYSLPVSLDRNKGTWRVSLNKGFNDPGLRWLRLKSTNSSGGTVGSQLIYITVSSDSLTVGDSLTVKLLQNTLFKIAPIDSARLTSLQKIRLNAGTTVPVEKYGFVDGHLKVVLKSPVAPIGDFGYFFEPHAELRKGTQVLRFEIGDVPDIPSTGELLVTETTYIKLKPEPASNLPANQKGRLLLGQSFGVLGYASLAGHFRVTLKESVPGFGKVGYIYRNHVRLRQDGKLINYDPNALTLTIRQQTVLKRRPVASSQLSAGDKATLPTGRVYGVAGYKIESEHVKVTLTEQLPGYGNTGYLFPDHVWVRRGGQTVELFPKLPKYVELNVPYLSQRWNPRYYWSTCNVTAIAMVFAYYGIEPEANYPLADDLLEWIFNRYGEGSQTDHEVLQRLIRAYGFETSFSLTRKWREIDWEVASGRPVVLAGDFVQPSGHIVTVTGYTPEGLIVNDPWGDALTGYSNTEGARLFYPNGYVNQMCGPDGNIWAHFIKKK